MDTSDSVSRSISKGSYIDQLAGQLLLSRAPDTDGAFQDAANLPLDRDWIKQSFLTPLDVSGTTTLSKDDRLLRRFSSATMKYTDSSIGGNIAINPPTQFTRYADIRDPGLHGQSNPWLDSKGASAGSIPNHVSVGMRKDADYGMGRYYSEAIDDNSQIIHLRFGVPTYNSLTQFFTGFYSSGMASIARAGRFNDDFVNSILRVSGNLIGLAIAPLFLVPIAILAIGTAARYFLGVPSTKFYYMKPTMPTYWSAVSTIVNQMSSLMGLTNDIGTKQARDVLAKGDGIDPGGTSLQTLVSTFLPHSVMNENGFIDVRSIASRSKRLQMQFNKRLSEILESSDPNQVPYDEVILKAYVASRNAGVNSLGKLEPETYMQKWIDSWFGKSDSKQGAAEQDFRADVTQISPDKPDFIDNAIAKLKQGTEDVLDFFNAEVADGSDWVSFRVDYTGPTQESFDNSTTQSSLAGKINSMSASNREIRFNLAEGNVLPGMGSLIEGVSQIVGGAAEVLHIDGIASLAGSAFVDIPDHWDNSHASLPSSDYTIRLISPYNNPISQMFSIYIPLACLMAGVLPLATGAQSYTSPFLCQLHDRGRSFVRLGMMSRLSITRGTSNLGFSPEGKALAIDVSFSVKDMSSVMALPITTGFSILNPLQGLFDDQNSFSDYMMAIAGVPLSDTIYKVATLKYRAQAKYNDINSYFSASHIASMLTGVPGVGLLNAVFRGTNK